MKIITRIPKKLAAILILLMLASSVILMKGCGGSGTGTGECGEDTAPFGSTIDTSGDLSFSINATGSGFPATAALGCVDAILFTVLDPSGNPLSDMVTQIRANGDIALARNAPLNCVTNTYSSTTLLTQSDPGGTISIDLDAGVVSRPTATEATTSIDYIVRANSCTAQGATKVTFTVTW